MPEPGPLGVLAPEAQKKGGGLAGFFGGGKGPTEPTGPGPQTMSNVMDEVNNASRRVRVLEDRYQNIRAKITLIEQNMLENQKKTLVDLSSIQDDLLKLKRTISELDAKTNVIIKEIQLTAKKEDVEVLKKYLDLWEPVNFVTRNQVDRMINDAIEVPAIRLAERLPPYQSGKPAERL